MTQPLFRGAAAALVTPFREGKVDVEALRRLVDFQLENGAAALISCGTTGEPSTLTMEEREQVIRETVKAVNGRVPVICGTGANCTQTVIDNERRFRDLGCAAQLVVTPYYNKTTQRGLIAHFTAIADAVNIPIILYNIPGRTGMSIEISTAKVLAKHKNIVAVKEASGNIGYTAKLIAACGDDLDVYSGNDDMIVPIMSLGGKGVISVLSHVLPKETHLMAQYCLENNFAEASKLQIKYLDLINNLFVEVNPIPVKEAMNLIGVNVGGCRMPLYPMSDENREKLRASLAKHGLIK